MFFHLGYPSEAEGILSSSSLLRFKLSDQESKNLLTKAESSKLHSKAKIAPEGEGGSKPLLLKEIQPHVIFLELAKELIVYNEISRAKGLLEESEKHAKILFDLDTIAEIEHLYGKISYLEGDYKSSLLSHMSSHKLIKSLNLWESSAVETVKTLKKMKKFIDIKKIFLPKLTSVLEEVLENPNLNYNRVEISQILSTVYLLFMRTYLGELKTDFSYETFKQALEYWGMYLKQLGGGRKSEKGGERMEEEGGKMEEGRGREGGGRRVEGGGKKEEGGRSEEGGGGVKFLHLKLIVPAIYKLTQVVERLDFTDRNLVERGFKALDRLGGIGEELEVRIKGLLKYTMGMEKEGSYLQTPLHAEYSMLKITLSRIYGISGILKGILRKPDYGGNMGQEIKVREGDEKEARFSEFEPLNRYLVQLTNKIER